MIYSLRGKLIDSGVDFAVIECGGVGYRCAVSLATATGLSDDGDVMLFTHMAVKEDSIDLYGFIDRDELACFRTLIAVNGVGAKMALSLLSTLGVDKLTLAVEAEDIKTLTQAPGVGTKLASRVVLELKGKLAMGSTTFAKAANVSVKGGNLSEAAEALVALGYNRSDAAVALSGCDESETVEQMVKKALRALAMKL